MLETKAKVSVEKNQDGTLLGKDSHLTEAGLAAALCGGFSDAEFRDLEKIYDKLINRPDKIEDFLAQQKTK